MVGYKAEREAYMKTFVGMLISFSLLITSGCGFGISTRTDIIPVYTPNQQARLVSFYGGEPPGFNGINWGAELSSVEGMIPYGKRSDRGKIDFYLREGDVFIIGNGKREPLQYGFWNGKFYIGMVTTQGVSDWNALKEAVFNKLGEGAKPFSNREDYLWVGKNATAALRFDQFSGEGTFYIRSDSLAKQMESSS